MVSFDVFLIFWFPRCLDFALMCFIHFIGAYQVVIICVYVYKEFMILHPSQVHKEKTRESARWYFCRSVGNVYEHIWNYGPVLDTIDQALVVSIVQYQA